MITISGYHIDHQLHESANSIVYRGHRQKDNQSVILKVLKQEHPSPKKIAWFKREYNILHNLDLPGVIKPYSIHSQQHRWIMVLEDFGGISLAKLMDKNAFALPDFLPLAIQITHILGQLHQNHIIHKDINPANIVLNPSKNLVKLIDFGISTILSQENLSFHTPTAMEGTLTHMAPEQTGRMNRVVDYRADFYALGVTFYQLLTNQLPFPTTDAMELVHYHIAKRPQPPHEVKADIPMPLSAIIMKLLAKNAEDRYQSAYGLEADLKKCWEQWQSLKHINPFPLGWHDISAQFQISQKLYGREAEIKVLLSAFERVSQAPLTHLEDDKTGQAELVLISGYPGIGKSALVQEIYKPITRQRGYFISGKFDLLQRNIPYASLIQAFQSLIQQVLTESETQIAKWRDEIMGILGANAQVMIDVIPKLEMIIGPQNPAPKLDPLETQNRFNLLFQNFIHLFAQPAHPLVIFLDDLQWADAASLKLIHLLLTDLDSRHLLLIGAYRHQETSSVHPLMSTLAQLYEANVSINRIELNPLRLPHVSQLIADTLKCTANRARPLAELVMAKTRGNPFFINEFLKSLYANKRLKFAPLTAQTAEETLQTKREGGWQWDLDEIQKENITDNVVDLMADKIHHLSTGTQRILQLAACIGNRFDLETLAIVCNKPPHKTASDLWESLGEGLILPLGDAYKLADLDIAGLSDDINIAYKFAHDRIQQAVYDLISEEEKQSIHQLVGRLLLQKTPLAERPQKLFDIVNQLNLGQMLLTQQSDRTELAELNLQAGRRASLSAAYEPALAYFRQGISLLVADSWQTHYNLSLALYVEAAESANLSTNFAEMTQLIETVLEQATTLLDKVEVYKTLIQAQVMQNKLLEAIKLALKVLALLGVSFPENPTQADVDQSLAKIQALLAEKDIDHLTNLPKMTDPNSLAALQIIARVFSAAYLAMPELMLLFILKMVNLSIKHGNAPISSFAYASYGLILCGVGNDIKTGYQFGQLALDLLDRLEVKRGRVKTLEIVNAFVAHWKIHVKETLQPLQEGYQNGLDTGDLQYAMLCAFVYVYHAYTIGRELGQVEADIKAYGHSMRQMRQEIALNLNELYGQVVLNLMYPSEHPNVLKGESYDETKMLPIHLAANDHGTAFHVYFNKMYLSYLFQNFEAAATNAKITKQYLGGVTASLPVPIFHFYDSLVHLAIYSKATDTEQALILEKVAHNQEKLKAWAAHGPMNHHHKYILVEAERARIMDKKGDAREYYDQAIALAQKSEYINEEALAHELAGQFYLAHGKTRIAYIYLQDAHYAYTQWGAKAKTKHLELQYPECFAQFVVSGATTSISTTFLTTTGYSTTKALDMISVIKSSQTISSEIVLDKLLNKLIKLVIENAGAQRGCLILRHKGKLLLEAEASIDQDTVSTLQSIPLESSESHLPVEIINYVARTKESLVLNNASREGNFTRIKYIINNQPRSILCVALLNRGKLLGLIYLENNLVTNAFTPERVEIVRLLGTQATISITNAKAIAARAERERLQIKNEFLEKHSQELAKLNADKDKFFSIVSHDLRSPFTALLGNAQLTLSSLDTLTMAEIERSLQGIYMTSKAAFNLLENLLNWSRIQRGRMEYHPTQISLSRSAQDTLNLLNEVASSKQIQLANTISDTIWVYADRNMLDAVIRNLVSNALKFTYSGGLVTISAQYKGGDADSEDRYVEVAVSDTGVGMNQETVETLFRLDTHHSTYGTAQERGTGLGLIICQEMVEKNKGEIWVESELGKGTSVKFTVPFDEASLPPTAILEEHPPKPAPPTPNPISENQIKPSSKPIIPPSQADLAILQELALRGDMRGLYKWSQGLREKDEKFIPFADKLQDLTNSFDESAISALINEFYDK